MPRYIDADKLLEELKEEIDFESPMYTEEQRKYFGMGLRCAYRDVVKTPTADVVEVPNGKIGDVSDGYHTFNELYHHRAILFSVICNSMPDKAWKSKLHDTGDMFDGMFIVGIETEQGQATYHYDIEPYWDMFKVKELEKAPKWDGHTPQEAIDRILKLSADVVPRSEYEKMKEKADRHLYNLKAVLDERAEAKQDVAKEIFEEIEKTIMNTNWTSQNYKEWYFGELKKKYIGEGNERSKG